MGPGLIVVVPPVFNHHPGVSQVQEPVTVQALIPELAIETLDVSVLRRFARCNKVQPYPAVLGPGGQGFCW